MVQGVDETFIELFKTMSMINFLYVHVYEYKLKFSATVLRTIDHLRLFYVRGKLFLR